MGLKDIGTVKETTVITITDPRDGTAILNADKTPMTVTIYGPYSQTYRSVLRAQQQKRAADMTRAARSTLDPDELEAMSSELTLQCIADWNLTLEGAKKLPFTPENVAMVLTDYPWLRDQINAAMGNVAYFLDSPKTP